MAMPAVALLNPVMQANPVVGEHELTRRRIVRAIRGRLRYRYVKPSVKTTDEGWLITSPCCSRNIDPEGGIIEIARLSCDGEQWSLFMRNGDRNAWVLHSSSDRLAVVLRCLCEDKEREFWP